MNIAEYAVHKKTITLVMTFLLLGGGLFSYERLGRFEDPEFTIKEALVVTNYPGALPSEVEEEVTDVLETAIQQLSQLKKLTSLSRAGQSIIIVEMKDKYDKYTLPQVWDELRRKVNDVQSQLPPGAQPSIVNDDFGDVYGIFFAVTGDGYSYKEIKDYVDFLKRELLLVPGVAKIEIWGAQQEAIFVEISHARLAQLGIPTASIYQTLEQQNLVASAGHVKVGNEYILIYPTGGIDSVEEIGELLISDQTTDKLIYLKEVATISRDYITPPSTLLRFNGQPGLAIGISSISGGNVVTLGKAIKAKLKTLEAQSPLGMELGIISYQSDTVETEVNRFMGSFLSALAIVIVVLLIFMGLRSGLLIGAVLVLTVCGTVIVMDIYNIDLHRISLGALIIALGMLVDNAIVITEAMLIKIQTGTERIRAAKEVVAQTMWPLFGATVVAVLAFAAIGLSQNAAGEFTRSLFQVMLISLMMSWVIAITITPLFCIYFLKADHKTVNADPYRGLIYQIYKIFLYICLRLRWLTVVMMLGLLFLAIYAFGLLEDSFFPGSTRPQFMLDYWRTEGTDIRATSTDLQQIEQFVMQLEGVESVTSFIGMGGLRFMLVYAPEKNYTSYGQLLITVDDYRRITDLIPVIQRYLDDHFPDAEPKLKQFRLGPGSGAMIKARFSGPDPVVLRQLSEQAQAIMRADGGAKDIRDDWRQRVKVSRPQFAEVPARLVGVSRTDVSLALQTAFGGRQVGIYREGNQLLPIIARSPATEWHVDSMKEVQIWSPAAQKSIQINQVVSGFVTEWQDAIIHRHNRKRTITPQCDPKVGNASVVFQRIRPKIEAIELPIGYELEWGGEYEDSRNAQQALAAGLPITFLIMVLVVIFLFNSLRQPLIIWLCVPLAIIGVAAGLLLTKQSFGFMALLGFLSLSGMLIKNAVVLIDQIDLEIREGKQPFQAILESSVSRLRPVMMAAITTVLGMIPLVFDAFFIGMAVTIMFGLTFATLLTLIVVPVLYAIFFQVPNGEL